MPEPRKIRDDERELVAELYNNAYRVGAATGRAWIENADLDETIAFVEEGRVASIVRMLPYTIWIGGHEVAMGGISGVATWMDCQGKGYAGELMRRSVALMRERGLWTTALYPFAHRYYRRFGWETAGDRMVYSEITQSDLNRYDERHLVRAALRADDVEKIAAVYKRYAQRYNGMVSRTDANWQWRLSNLTGQGGQAYLIEEAGEAAGYFFCENQRSPSCVESRTIELACLTPAAWRAMMGFLATLPNVVTRISVTAPVFPPLFEHFSEPTLHARRQPSFMFRVVDVEQAVARRGYPDHAHGGITIAIRDECGAWNDGTWELQFSDGKGIAVKTTARKPDLELTIQRFSQLYLGYIDLAGLSDHGMLPRSDMDKLRLLRNAFHDRPPYLMDAF
ncbi:MAG: GNAT family N-acetyltransferase [Candidatus Sumerlaeota bacterium]|nr:GNAT family N-acetyltransferase [Candidatus Sumerlaeota bacterium]